jgi:hypothetical protein
MHYRQVDDEFFEVFSDTSSRVFGSISSTAFPATYKCLFTFCAKLGSLKTGMFECVDTNNPYAFKILFRCFCEHYLRFMYVWSRFTHERSDQAGLDFYNFCGAAEAVDYVNSLAATERLLGNEALVNAKKVVAALYPEVQHVSSAELERRSAMFKYRSILRFLASEPYEFVATERPFLAHIVPAYALLSSFVHGGPYADLEMAEFSQPHVLEECHSNAEVVVLMAASVYMLTAAAVAREHPAVGDVAAKVNSVLKPLRASGEA